LRLGESIADRKNTRLDQATMLRLKHLAFVEYRRIYVLGEVKIPGGFPYTPGMTALNAAAVAGGFTIHADRGDVIVTRSGKRYRGTLESVVQPGDSIEVGLRMS
jgi:protein involved in polysaccharide export with SLBB domain